MLGLSEGTTCYVTAAYFDKPEPFSDYIVHEAAHVFHNCKRDTVGLASTRTRQPLPLRRCVILTDIIFLKSDLEDVSV